MTEDINGQETQLIPVHAAKPAICTILKSDLL